MRSDEQKQDDMLYIAFPHYWLDYPLLPLKSTKVKSGLPPVGVMVVGVGPPLTVYHVNMFTLSGVPLDKAWAESTLRTTYQTVEELVDEWEVD